MDKYATSLILFLGLWMQALDGSRGEIPAAPRRRAEISISIH